MKKILEILLGRVGHIKYWYGVNFVDGGISNNSVLVLPKWIWNPDMPAIVPEGARISAGKSGKVFEVISEKSHSLAKLRSRELYPVSRVSSK